MIIRWHPRNFEMAHYNYGYERNDDFEIKERMKAEY